MSLSLGIFGKLRVLHHPLFHLSTIAFELGSDLSSFHSTMHLILHCMAVKASARLVTYSTLHSDCISFISLDKVTHSLHFTLQILHFILIALLPYCKGFPIALNMQYGP